MISLSLSNVNEEYFNLIKIKYPHLKDLTLTNNHLNFLQHSIDLKNFKLQSLKDETFFLYPFDVLNIIKIHVDVIDEIEYLKKNDYNANFLYIEVRTILVKKVIDNYDIDKLNKFIDVYLLLRSHQDYLVDDAANKFNFMQSVIRDNVYGEFTSPGISHLIQRIEEVNQRNSKNKGMSLTLTNPNYHTTNYNENDYINYHKAGYATAMLLIYIVLNIGFILAVILIN